MSKSVRSDKANYAPMSSQDRELHKSTLLKKLFDGDASVFLMKPDKTSKSYAWMADCFSMVYEDNVKQNFVYCKSCKNLITYNSVHGTGSLLRHNCYRQKISAANDETLGSILKPALAERQQLEQKFEQKLPETSNICRSTKANVKCELTKQKRILEDLILKRDPSIEIKAPSNIKSEIWSSGNFRIIYQDGQRLDFVLCLYCDSLITYRSKTGTASLLRHSCMKRDFPKKNVKIDHETGQVPAIVNPTTADVPASPNSQEVVTIPVTEVDNIEEQYGQSENYDQGDYPEEFKEEASKLLQILGYKDMQPSFLYKKGFLDFGQYLINIGAEYGKVNIQNILENRNQTSESYFLNVLQKMLKPKFDEQKIVLSCDYWRDENRKTNFLTLYGHFIDDNFEIKKVNLGTVSFTVDFSEIDYKHLFVSILESYFATESEAEAFLSKTTIVIFDEIGESFKNYSTIKCACLTINRIVKAIIKHSHFNQILTDDEVRCDENWSQIWEQCSNSDEPKMKELHILLNPFVQAVKSLGTDHVPKINEVYIFRKKFLDHLKISNVKNDDLKKMILTMINEHFSINNVHKIAIFLDPRFKSLKFMTNEEKASVLTTVGMMISSDESNTMNVDKKSNLPNSAKLNETQLSETDSSKFLIEYMDINEEQEGINDEVDAYLNMKISDVYSANILEFWESRYDLPHLRQLAKEILCIPAAAVGAEKIFSDDAMQHMRRRLNMEIENVKQMLYIHDNFDLLSNVL